ncbi:MAG: 3-phosphoserine/phosphohydroxythreonine transaminase [Gammaproteobacteria bacterium]
MAPSILHQPVSAPCSERGWNFGPGPALLPDSVLTQARDALWCFEDSGMGIAEISHRSKRFLELVERLQIGLRSLLAIPSTHDVLLIPGGATPHFSLIPINLALARGTRHATYAITGHWSRQAHREARTLIDSTVAIDIYTESGTRSNVRMIPELPLWSIDSSTAFLYYTDNESIDGIEFPAPPAITMPPLVSDMTANLFSRPVPIDRFDLIYAGVQKNLGITGLSIVIIRKDHLHKEIPGWPPILCYGSWAESQSMYNTPPTLNWYFALLMVEWMEAQGGLEALAARNDRKSSLLYQTIDQSGGFYQNAVSPTCRSRMNVPFTLTSQSLTEQFLKEASHSGLLQLEGHRTVGGCRASIYNAMPEAGVQNLCEFMNEFRHHAG